MTNVQATNLVSIARKTLTEEAKYKLFHTKNELMKIFLVENILGSADNDVIQLKI